ncbi:type II toxin-antitoxin system HicB family antitoxin [Sinomonas sp. ASV322]|uniref:type II toxin-antitoxin system HicB family antitoxin n=1 Tax=Sinomonas sp. ASV322 TaxID=3041920 RepID=UPI0027DD659B|nr:type II toxin-antitoxin system HicB family antitoxin [Sinomonas sp. ASV322]MDQ4503599.1 type II toxin-antitoxin system HicB family antitoxin [Sinomonas sp. ASV322]
MKLSAKVHRDGRFWYVSVPEIPGLITQGRTLSEVREMVLDQASARTGRPEAEFEVELDIDEPEAMRAIHHADQLAKEADALRQESAEERRNAARILQAKGLTVREIGAVLHVSHQRAAQLLTVPSP